MRAIFIVRKHLQNVPVQAFNMPRGTIQVSTLEATAADLVGYNRHAGGLDQVATSGRRTIELGRLRITEAGRNALAAEG